MSKEAQHEQAWQDLLAQLEKYHPEELAAIDRVAAEQERARHSPISADDLRRHPRRWHGSDKVLYTLRLDNLRRKGYIDLPPTLSDAARKIDDDFHVPSAQFPPDPDPRYAHSRRHPVLRERCWSADHITPRDYRAIEPALTLASCLLSEPIVLAFYTGLLEGVRTLDRPDVIEKYNNDPANEKDLDRLFHFGAQLGPYDRETLTRTWRKLYDMQKHVQWGFKQFSANDDGVTDGETLSGEGDRFAQGTTADSIITLNEDFLIGIRYVSELEKRGYPVKIKVNEFWYLKTGTRSDQVSADIRRQFYLAVTILHELTHAVWNSVHERFPDVSSSTDLGFEPFYGDQHINELGLALEQAIFGGKILPSGPVPALSPYGLQIRDFPGLYHASDLGENCVALGSAREYGIYYDRRAPIKAIDYLKFFKRQFWATDVPGTGGKALMVPRHVAVRVVAKEDRDDFDSDDEAVRTQALAQPWTSHDVLVADGWRNMRTLAVNRRKPLGDDTEPADGGDDLSPMEPQTQRDDGGPSNKRQRQDQPDDDGPSNKRQRQDQPDDGGPSNKRQRQDRPDDGRP